MKILFLCGSLERGRDGVGDYTRRLAIELIRQGHKATAVALNDNNIVKQSEEVQKLDNIEFPVLRLPNELSSKERFSLATKWIQLFNPEWISLQYVPYSFHKKGLPFGLASFMQKLGKGNNWHIMFHETWIGAGRGSNLKQKLTSFFQKLISKQLVAVLKPAVIHTHLPLYHHELKKFGWEVKQLPLFSNIPVKAVRQSSNESNIFRIGIFSQVECSECIIAFLSEVSHKVACSGMQFEILVIGGTEERMQKFISFIGKIESLKNKITYTGFLSEEQLSWVLRNCSIGLTSVPRHALGKSGSVAAFLAHGVPIAAPTVHSDQHVMNIGFFSPNLRAAILMAPDLNLLENTREAALCARSEIHPSIVAKKFISDLSVHDHPVLSNAVAVGSSEQKTFSSKQVS